MKKIVSVVALAAVLVSSSFGSYQVAAAAAKPTYIKDATGLGIVTSIASSKSATAEAAGNAQVDSTIAAVTVGKDGKITKCQIDAAQTKIALNAKGEVTADKAAAIQTKNEKGEGYGMKKSSKIGKEWNDQAAAFAKWTIGKTVDEVKGLKTKKVDDSHTAVPDVADLTSSVTVSVGDMMEAVVKAAQTPAQGTPSGTGLKTGLGVVTGIGSSKNATAEAAGNAQVDSTVVAVTVDGSGKIVSCIIDNAQTKIPFNAKGEVTADKAAAIKTKLELGSAYGMVKNSKISKEWNEQATAFSKWVVGKTVDQVKALKVKKVDDNHTAVPDTADLSSSVTVTVGDFISAIEKAVKNAN